MVSHDRGLCGTTDQTWHFCTAASRVGADVDKLHGCHKVTCRVSLLCWRLWHHFDNADYIFIKAAAVQVDMPVTVLPCPVVKVAGHQCIASTSGAACQLVLPRGS